MSHPEEVMDTMKEYKEVQRGSDWFKEVKPVIHRIKKSIIKSDTDSVLFFVKKAIIKKGDI